MKANIGSIFGAIKFILIPLFILPSVHAQQPKAVVLVGNVDGAVTAANNTALEAASDFNDAGYEVVMDNEATVATAVTAISDPDVRAVCIIAHGDPIICGRKCGFNEGVEMSGDADP